MRIHAGIPAYDDRIQSGILTSFVFASKEQLLWTFTCSSLSILTKNFNGLFCEALNKRKTHGITHFLLWHADIVPLEPHWLDKMASEMKKSGADILSCVVPLKNMTNECSTALQTDDPFTFKNLTYEDLLKEEETFTHPKLVVNSGLMLIDITKPWVESIRFRTLDNIRVKDGIYIQEAVSEDWLFSIDAKDMGAKIFATKAIRLEHVGSARWSAKTQD